MVKKKTRLFTFYFHFLSHLSTAILRQWFSVFLQPSNSDFPFYLFGKVTMKRKKVIREFSSSVNSFELTFPAGDFQYSRKALTLISRSRYWER